MSKIPTEIHTHLEVSADVESTLNWKVKSLTEKNLSVEMGISDYLNNSISNLEKELDYSESVRKEAIAEKKRLTQKINNIKEKSALFLLSMGVEKSLKGGVTCSSVKIKEPTPAKETTETKKTFKLLIEEDEMQELLITLGKAEIIEEIVVKKTVSKPASITIYGKRVIPAEIIEEETPLLEK